MINTLARRPAASIGQVNSAFYSLADLSHDSFQFEASKYGNSCTDPDCVKLYGMSKTNFTNATDESILAIVEQVDTTFDSAVVSYSSSSETDSTVDDNKLVSIIQSSADILYGISLRETETEPDSIILYYLKLMNEILNISLDVFKTSHQQSNSSNK